MCRVSECFLFLFLPPSVHRFSNESRFGQLFQDWRLTVTVGGRGTNASLLWMVEGHSRLSLYITQLLDQTEAGDI